MIHYQARQLCLLKARESFSNAHSMTYRKSNLIPPYFCKFPVACVFMVTSGSDFFLLMNGLSLWTFDTIPYWIHPDRELDLFLSFPSPFSYQKNNKK